MRSLKIILYLLLMMCCRLQAQQTEKLYLSGTGSDQTVNWQFYCTEGMNAGKWSTIPVPSCWELQGFGKYDYGFARDSVRGKEKGLYKYSFNVPAGWQQKKVMIVFEGSMTDTEVKINGTLAGEMHQGAFYAFTYDITNLLKFGQENLLEVTVAKHSANESVNDAERRADFWIFGGIFRPVYMEALPQSHIENVAVDAKANGAFTSLIQTGGEADRVTVQLFRNGAKYGNPATATVASNSATIKTSFSSPLLWSSESPNLYTALFTLYNNGKSVHTMSKRIGFRTVEVKERDGLYVNGVKVKLKGVNRHSFHPESGRATSKKISIADVVIMKEMNMNAVRMSHYPPDDHFLDVCDSLGLFVMDELAGWHGHYDTKTGTKLVKEMLAHDVNHPSIIIWANGNEGGHNTELDTLFRQFDIQKRPVVHPWLIYGGFDTQHYREYNYGIGNYEQGREIVMPTEFLHGLYDGGHGAGLEDYWEKMWHNPLSAGGFLWDFADQGVVRKDKNGIIDTDGPRGADGIVGPYHEREGSYYAIKEIWSPIYFERREITPAFNGMLNIENRYHFTNTSRCTFFYNLEKLSGADQMAFDDAKITAPNIKPGSKGQLKLQLPANWRDYDVLYVTARDPFKRTLFRWSFPIVRPATVLKNMMPKATGKVHVDDTTGAYVIHANDLRFIFNRRSGVLELVRKGDSLIPFSNGPILQEAENNFSNFSHWYENDTFHIASAFDRKTSYNTLHWTIYPSGLLKMQVNYFPGAYFTSMVGVNFSFPEKDIKAVEYMGYGPYRVWKNRMKGNQFGIWRKEYNNTETGEQWLYPEFKGYHAGMYWCKFTTSGQSFTVMTGDEGMFLRLFTPAWKTDQWKNYETIFPTGDISFMQGIPGIGTKTQRNETTGPMGMKHIYYDYEKDRVRWRNITLYFNFTGDK